MSDADPNELIIQRGELSGSESMWLTRDQIARLSLRLLQAADVLEPVRWSPNDSAMARAEIHTIESLSGDLDAIARSVQTAFENYSVVEDAISRSARALTETLLWTAELVAGPAGVFNASFVAVAPSVLKAAAELHEMLWFLPAHVPFVRVRPGPHFTAGPPQNFTDCAMRIPQAGEEQIRIEHYVVDGEDRWALYIAGTRASEIGQLSQPFDMHGNLDSVVGNTSEAEKAVRAALAAAGNRPGDPILVVGHSQGGMIGAALAEDPHMNVRQLITFGAPLGTSKIGVPTVDFRIDGDAVPALAGFAAASAVLTTVIGSGSPDASLRDRHSLTSYQQLSAQADKSQASVSTEAGAQLRAFTGGSQAGEVTIWTAERTAVPGEGGETRRAVAKR